MRDYNIFSVLKTAIDTFDNKTINVVPNTSEEENKRYLQATTGYQFSQRRLLNDIDLALNSVYKNGRYDKEGQRKLYLNIVRFYRNVAVKNTDVDVKNFVFTPADYSTENIWAVWFFKRQFSNWVKLSGFSKTINDLNSDFNTYGSCVLKRVKNDVLRVPLRSLRMDQSATTLQDGVEGGAPLIIEHEYSYIQMSKFKDWELPEEFEGKRTVYESYMYMPQSALMRYQGADIPNDEELDDSYVLVMAVVMPTGRSEEDKRKKYDDKVLFIEQVEELPFQECHSEKVDGRWLGVGEVEKQLENQIARNLSANMRRRSMLWASKNIFQTQGDAVNKNLIKSVQDGEVMQVGLNGLITRVDTQTRGLADYAQDEQVWDENSQKQAFAFESATGESFSSGTPFRLGAMLSNSVMSYFDQKKEVFGLFLQKSFFEEIIPIFQRRAKDDIAVISQTEEGYNMLKELFIEMQTNHHYAGISLSPNYFDAQHIPTRDEVRQEVETKLIKSPYLFVDIPKDVYKNARYNMDLDITGESKEPADKETLVTLYTALSQKGDPRSERVLEVLLASMGKNLQAIAGQAPSQSAQQVNPVQASSQNNPDLAGLVPNTTQ
jgi:hypothetical protein